MYKLNYNISLYLVVFFLFLCLKPIFAQTLSNFPYSALGVGEYDFNAQGMLSGMGYGVSAIRSSSFLNTSNPASYSALQNKLVIGELSTTGRHATLTQSGNIGNSNDFNVSRFAVGLKVSNFWGSSLGILPLTTVMYQIVDPKKISGSKQTIQSIYEGNGGLHQFYWGNGFRIGRHLSLGVQLNYIFGSINQIERVAYDVSNPILSYKKQTYLRNINFSYGLQYFTDISDKLHLSIALKYQSKRSLNASYNTSIISDGDTLSNESLQDNYFTIPDQYRAGFAITYDNKLTIDFDYISWRWNKLSVKNNNISYTNSNYYGLGLKWDPLGGETTYRGNLLKQLLFECGVGMNSSYLKISNEPINDFQFSIGTGIYNRKRNISLSTGVTIGQKGASYSGAIHKSYTNLYLTLVVRNLWFLTSKYR